MSEIPYEEFGEKLTEGRYRGVSRGPGASLDKALQQAARAAAENGKAGQELTIESITIEVQEHNQWVKVYSVIAGGGG